MNRHPDYRPSHRVDRDRHHRRRPDLPVEGQQRTHGHLRHAATGIGP